MEAILFLLVCFLFVTGTTGFMSQRATQHELTGSMDRSQELERVRQSAEHMLVTQKVDTEAILSLAHQIKMAGLQGISLQDLNSNLKYEAIGGILSRLKGESDFETQHRRELQERVNEQIEGLVAMFAIASLLSLSSLVLLRSAARREADLESARDDAVRHQDRYKQVAENLPIGFFTFSQNQFEYTNSAWDSMTNRQPDQGPWDAFMNAIHPDDMKFVKTTLTRAEKDSTPFSLSFKMKIQQKQDRYFEARGVPIFDGQGRVEHFVGFVNDVTTQVASQSQLEEKNQEIESSNFMLRQALRVLEENFEAMVHSLVKVVEAKDPYTAGHSERVMGYSVMIAEDLGLDESSVRTVKMGSLIHDIGKIGIPDSILTKPNGLSDAEYALIRQHPVIGARMVESIPSFQACLPIVMSHHERLDGKGYPDCLVANQLSLFVRIVTVADCFDAMTSNRAYRIGLPVVEAIAELRKEVDSGGLDGKIVETLADIVSKGGLLWSEPYSKAA